MAAFIRALDSAEKAPFQARWFLGTHCSIAFTCSVLFPNETRKLSFVKHQTENADTQAVVV